MKKFAKCILCLLVLAVIALAACSYANKTSIPQTLSDLSSALKSKAQVATAIGRETNSLQISDNEVQYYFPRADQKPEPVLVKMIGSAKSSLDMAIYSFTETNVASALIEAKKRGVAVRVISDRECSQEQSQKKLLNLLKSAGVPVKVNSHAGLMHLKMTIADRQIVTTGSYNYTYSAETENDEVFVVMKNDKAAGDFDNEFSQMWNDVRNYKNFG